MTKTRADFAAAVRPFAPGEKLLDEHMPAFRALADSLGLAADEPGTELTSLSPSLACITLIQEFEGYGRDIGGGMVRSYPDPATGRDPWTIGWGTTGPDVREGTTWTKTKAEERFVAHVADFAWRVRKLLDGAATTQNQFDAMVSLAYNIGSGAFGESTLLKKHKVGDYAGAAAEFDKWVRGAGKIMPGLVRRRKAERKLYEG